MIIDVIILTALVLAYIIMIVIIGYVEYDQRNRLAAILLRLGFIFVKPLIVMWLMKFMFQFHFDYWQTFGLVFLIGLLTVGVEESDYQQLNRKDFR